MTTPLLFFPTPFSNLTAVEKTPKNPPVRLRSFRLVHHSDAPVTALAFVPHRKAFLVADGANGLKCVDFGV